MKIRPSNTLPRERYVGSALKPPGDQRSFTGFVARLAAFHPHGILDIGSRLLWYAWRNPERAVDSMENQIVCSVTPEVIELALAYASGSVDATEQDLRLLAWEYHDLPAFPDSETAATVLHLRALAKALSSLPAASVLRRIPLTELRVVRALWLLGRFKERRSSVFAKPFDDFVRSVLIYEELREGLAPKFGEFLPAEQAFFRTSHEALIQSTMVLAASGDHEDGLCPGRIDVARESGVVVHGDVTLDDLRITAQLLGRREEQYRSIGHELMLLTEDEAPSSALLNTIRSRPVVLLTLGTADLELAIPAPALLFNAVGNLLLNEFVTFLAANGYSWNAWRERGEAFHRYLGKSLKNAPGVELVEADERAKRPDLVWRGECYGVVVEAKVRVTPNSDPERDSATSLIESWRRCAEAIEQGDALACIDSTLDRWVLVIVVQEPDAADVTSFRYAAARWGFLKGTKLLGLAVLSSGELESLVHSASADTVGRLVERLWIEACASDALDQPPERPTSNGPRALTDYLRAGWERVAPMMPLPAKDV